MVRALALLLLAFTACKPAKPVGDSFSPLAELIEYHLADKGIPAISIALVDDQDVVFLEDFGEAADGAVYRVGSVSKLYTDIAVMQLVEQGKLDLDAPVTEYLPDLGNAATLRQLMTHRSGMVREPPVGSYFDPAPPSIEKIVSSLHDTPQLLKPGSKVKYSNAALMTVGRVVEVAAGRAFAEHMQEAVLGPLGMADSSFLREARLEPRIPPALMWSYDGREFPAPTFDVLVPAGNLYSPMRDQAKLLQAIFRGGAPVLEAESLDAMLEPQFDPESSFGLGFARSKFEGSRRIGHGGAVYGFSTQLSALPEEKLGVVVSASRDVTNDVTRRIADYALRLLLARRADQPAPAWRRPEPVDEATRRRMAGKYAGEELTIRLVDRDGELWTEGMPFHRVQIRRLGDGYVTDGRLQSGVKVELGDETVRLGNVEYRRVDDELPPEPPAAWRELIGEYGGDHNTLFVLEREGELCALIEWVFLYPLTEAGPDVWEFPSYGLYHDEHVEFRRDEQGRVTSAVAAGIGFARREPGAKDGETFHITPVKPIEDLRADAAAASPPDQPAGLREPELVELTSLDPTLKLDIRYATTNNFMRARFYDEARAFLQRPAAEALVRAHNSLAEDGYGLLIHDAYRPWQVTKMFWDATPESMEDFVANPARGSVHNRGAAVDLTLYDLQTSQPVEMPSGYDEFSARAYPDYVGGTARQRWLRERLRQAMEAEGFSVYEYEWWHFNYRDADQYPVLNLPFEGLP